jgi:ABC-2 type transport system permease protein
VVTENLPVVAFDTGHSEQLDASTYKSLLKNNSFEAKDVNLLTDAIPEKAQMLVLGCPTTDYTQEEIKKLDAFLSSTTLAGDRSLLVTFHPSQKTMPNLATFLKEWGIEVPQAIIVESDQTKCYTDDASYILSNPQTDLSLGGKANYGYFTTPQSNPINLLFDSKETKKTYSLAKSNETCYLQDSSTKEGATPAKASYNTAVLSQDTVKSGDKQYKANVIAMGSTLMFNSEILGASTFGNAAYVIDLSKYATGTSNSATAVTVNPVQTNVADITLSAGASTLLGLGVFTFLIPLLIAIAGICVYRKRRHL